jgi:hypothetical protein
MLQHMWKVGLCLGLGASGFAHAQSSQPSITRAFALPNSTEVVYEAVDNDVSELKIFYYVPKRTVFDTIAGQSVFSYVPSRDGSASVEFRLSLAPSALVLEKQSEVISTLAKLAKVNPDQVRLQSMPLFTVKTQVFGETSELNPLIIPPDNVPATGGLPFYLEMSTDGTRWFRKNIVERSLPLGVLEAEVGFYDELAETVIRKPIKIPITLDAVPLCAVTALGCDFQW